MARRRLGYRRNLRVCGAALVADATQTGHRPYIGTRRFRRVPERKKNRPVPTRFDVAALYVRT